MSDAPLGFTGIWRADERARAAYSEGAGIYRIIPRAVAVPSSSASLQALVRWAGGEGVPLIPRGAGSAMTGSSVGDGVVVDCSALDGARLIIDPATRTARMSPGVTVGALNEAAGRFGLRFPVEPSSARWATIGGIIGTNAAGARSVRVGSTRAWIDGLTLVTGDGESLTMSRGAPLAGAEGAATRFRDRAEPAIRAARGRIPSAFPKVRKNATGYALDAYLASGDAVDLIIGAEGTLGFVTEALGRLEPIPRFRGGIRAALEESRSLSRSIPALLSLEPSGVEFLDASFLQFAEAEVRALPGGDVLARAAAVLMVEFESDDVVALTEQLERARSILQAERSEIQMAHDARELETLWAIRHAASPRLTSLGGSRRSLQVIEDGCVPVDKLGEYLAAVREITSRHGVEVVLFGHAGDGNVHANLLPDVGRMGWEAAVRAIYDEVGTLVLNFGGVPSGEHGDGRLRARLMNRLYGPEIVGLFRLVKAAFDPHGIMNPRIKLATTDPLVDLKVGSAAAALPPDIATALRRIEQTAGWGYDRLAVADDPSPPPVQ